MDSIRSWIEVNLDNIVNNFDYIKSLNPKTPIWAVVKADAYGHGLKEVVNALKNKTETFAVANINEAFLVKEAKKNAKVLIMSPVWETEASSVINNNFIPWVSNFSELAMFEKICLVHQKNIDIHIKIDTGMGRLGFYENQIKKALDYISKSKYINLTGIGSHYPSADVDLDFTKSQLKVFQKIVNEYNLNHLDIHIQNSAAAQNLKHPENFGIRLGIAIYGISASDKHKSKLKTAISFKTKVALIRKVPKDWSINYERTFKASKDLTVAILSAGYADGYPIFLSNKNCVVIINENICKILGKITMDQIVVDISDKDNINIGDIVTLIGSKDLISPKELANKGNTIAWELLTNFSSRTKKIFI